MSTKKISTISLPTPNYSLEVGSLNVNSDKPNSPQWIPRFSHLAQIVEVRRTGFTLPNQIGSRWKHLICPALVIENVNPELFLRRDFISKFVDTGAVHIVNDSHDVKVSSYEMYTKNNILTIILNEKQYRRFGLIAKKFSKSPTSHTKMYRVEVDLGDERIKSSNKYQDSLVQAMRRLNTLAKVYFRYVPREEASCQLGDVSADTLCLDYLKFVIDEYAIDGFKPVPLTGCFPMSQRLEKSWLNCSQVHPPLELEFVYRKRDNFCNIQRDTESLARLMEIVDWLGYQILSLDCDREEIRWSYRDQFDESERYDVACFQVRGSMDFEHINARLADIFDIGEGASNGNPIVLRSLILHEIGNGNSKDNKNIIGNKSSVVFLQDCSSRSPDVNLITVIGLSGEI